MNPYLSVVIPVLNEERNIEEIVERLSNIIKEHVKKDYEIIFVDDGSDDNTWNLVEKYHFKDIKIRGIRFTRNFGHQYALTAGIAEAKGDVIITMDGDLQHPPELITEFIKKSNEGYDIIAGQRISSEATTLLKKVFSNCYYYLFNKLSTVSMEPRTSDFRLITRKIADIINNLHESDRFYRAIFPWSGFKTYYLKYNAPKRGKGKPSFNFVKSFNMGIGGIISFSIFPLVVSIYLGFSIALLSFLYGSYAVIQKLILQNHPPGFTDIIASILFLSGIQLIFIGVIGIYIGKISRQVDGRPSYIIQKIIE